MPVPKHFTDDLMIPQGITPSAAEADSVVEKKTRYEFGASEAFSLPL